MANEQKFNDLEISVDEFYFSALLEEDHNSNKAETLPVSDAKYAEALQFQEALMGSVITSNFQTKLTKFMASSSSSTVVMLEPEETDRVSTDCGICFERTESDKMFRNLSCLHSFCSDCITKLVLTNLQESSVRGVRCPGENCQAVLELETFRATLPKGVIDKWEQALCEEMIGENERFYCPFKDCSGMLVKDSEGDLTIRESECPFCHRLFCVQCSVPWHSGVDCEQFQSLNEDERERDDLILMELAENHKWRRCPKCRFFVERTTGCPHITCRCKFEFCYGCGSDWNGNHSGCSRN